MSINFYLNSRQLSVLLIGFLFLVSSVCYGVDEEPEDVLSIKSEAGSRIWQVTDPLFEELLSEDPVDLPGEVGILWTHPFKAQKMRTTAIQYGLEYSLDETGEHFKQLNLHPVQEAVNVGGILAEKPYPQAGSLAKLNWYRAKGPGMPAVNAGGQSFLLAPANQKAYLEQTEAFLKENGDKIWGVYAGDEVILKQRKALFAIFNGQQSQHPYIEEIDEDVKQRYGLGKYGLPRGKSDEEPYKWIAMNRWLDDEWCSLLKDLREVVDRVAPEVILVSDDPVAGFKGYDFSLRGKYCDILTHQICPARNPLRQEFAFFTKLLVDMSGKTVFPCAHIENYVISMSPAETVETLSQIFRVGGTGLHYYPADVKGVRRRSQDTGYCRIGAPARWAAAADILRTAQEMPAVKTPESTGTMILMERSSYDALPITKVSNHAEYSACFDFLGSHIGSWFKFVHGGQLERDEVHMSDYKIVYLPMGKFFQTELADRMMEYVKGGGTVVCGDPEVFTYAADKDYLPPEAASVLGWSVQEKTSLHKKLIVQQNAFSSCMPTGSEFEIHDGVSAWETDLDPEWETLIAFEDGSPAIARREFGDGQWIQFTFQPFTPRLLKSEQLQALFKSIQENVNEPTDMDIWRFQFPIPDNLPEPPSGRCLTGNAVFWQQNEPVSVGGNGIEGKTVWTVSPNGVDQQEVPFTENKLCDRRQAVQAPNTRSYEVSRQRWAYQWNAGEPFELQVLFAEKQDVKNVSLWYSGTLPECEIKPIGDAQECSIPVASDAAGEDVLKLEVPCEWDKVEGVTIQFSARTEPMTLCEIEVWGDM